MRTRVPVAFALMASVLAGAAQASETLSVPSNPIPTATAARPAPGPLSGVLTLPDKAGPDKAGPSPVLILLHGCGGLGRGVVMQRWVERVNGWGYAAFVLDSFKARGVTSVCPPEDQPKVTAIDRAGDVLNAATVLAARPDIAGGHIGVIGFSHGGGTAMMVTRQAFENFHPGLIKAVVNYYGPCRGPRLHGHTPMLSLNGDADTWGDPARSCAEFDAQLRSDQPVELHTYPGVVHGFDNASMVRGRVMLGHPMKYDAAAAADSFERVRVFLDRTVLAAP